MEQKNTKFVVGFIILIAAIGIIFVAARHSSKPAAQPTTEKKLQKVTYGVSPFQDTILPIVAEQQGWYKEEGLDVQLKVLDWGDVMPAVASGAVDAAIQNFNSFQATEENISKGGGDVIFYYPFYIFRGAAIMVKGDGNLKPLSEFLKQYPDDRERAIFETVKQLKGKTILTTQGTEMEQIVLAATDKGGLAKNDVKIINAQPSDSLAAFLRGEGDGFSGGLTERIEASRNGAVVLIESADLTAPVIDGLVTTAKYAEQNPDTLNKLINLWLKTIQFMEQDLDSRSLMVTEYLGQLGSTKYSVEEYKYTWFNTQTYFKTLDDLRQALLNPSSAIYWQKSWDANNASLLKEEKIKEPIPYSAFWGEKTDKTL